MTNTDQFTARLAAAPHAAQIAFNDHMTSHFEDTNRADEVLTACMDKPVDMVPDRVGHDRHALNAPLWSDQEVIQILTDASVIDGVTGRPLGHWEMMRLQQRNMIRQALIKA